MLIGERCSIEKKETGIEMIGKLRHDFIEILWRNYSTSTPHVKRIESCLQTKNIKLPTLDHLAIIDLPGTHTGIRELQKIFDVLGYEVQGKDYLPEKQNDFTWLAEVNSNDTTAAAVLPQVVIADFRLEEMPVNVRNIICKYSDQAKPAPIAEMTRLLQQSDENHARISILNLLTDYFTGRDWPLPTLAEFHTVRDFNELLAWVLVFGRKPNHFTYSIHLMPEFNNLIEFHHFVENVVGLPLNQDGGVIKGGRAQGIEQGSTAGTPEQIQLADGTAELPLGFVEFVWRYSEKAQPLLWNDYFTGFVANHANRVIQSLYTAD